jgi:hypothetical protein
MSDEKRGQVKALVLCALAFLIGLLCMGCAAGVAGRAKVLKTDVETGAGIHVGVQQDE